jgi:flagellar FliJ protein
MKRFAFRLQRLLDLRRVREDALKTQVAACLRRLQAETRRLDDLVQQRRYAVLELVGMQNAGAEGIHIQQCAAYAAALQEQVERQKGLVAVARQALDAKRTELLEASRDRKALERLRETKATRHRAKVARDERVAENEVAITQFIRALNPST